MSDLLLVSCIRVDEKLVRPPAWVQRELSQDYSSYASGSNSLPQRRPNQQMLILAMPTGDLPDPVFQFDGETTRGVAIREL